MNSHSAIEVFPCFKKHLGIDLGNFEQGFLNDQLHLQARKHEFATLPEYMEALTNSQLLTEQLFESLSLGVSYFFREPMAFEIIEKSLFQNLITQKDRPESRSLRIWSAGCATGEEAYSIAAFFDLLIQQTNFEAKIEVFATDINPHFIAQAKIGVWPKERFDQTKRIYIKKYFEIIKDQIKAGQGLRKHMKFSTFNLLNSRLASPPSSIYGGFDFAFCRNVLIYYDQQGQEIIIKKLFKSLRKGGYLVLGESETLPAYYKDQLYQPHLLAPIFQKK